MAALRPGTLEGAARKRLGARPTLPPWGHGLPCLIPAGFRGHPGRHTWLGTVPPVEAPGSPRTPDAAPKGCSQVPGRVARGHGTHSPAVRPARRGSRPRPRPRPPTRSPALSRSSRLTQAARGGEQEAAPAPASAPGGGTRKRPPRPEPPCNRRRPEQSRAGPPRPARHGGRG